MYVYGELKYADLHNLALDPSAGIIGRLYWNTVTLKFMVDDGTNVRAMLRNDQALIIGSSGTAASNVRINRAGAGLLQFVLGSDVTAEGSWSATPAYLGANGFIPGFASTVTSGGTTVLVVGSAQQQYFTGTLTQTVTLPTTSIFAGTPFTIVNLSSGLVTVQSSGGNTIRVLEQNTQVVCTARVNTPTAAADWNGIYSIGVTGILPVANGGTGVSSSTGTVAVVLSTSPTIITPNFSSYVQFAGISTPSAPSSGNLYLYATTANSFTRPTYIANENLEITLGRDTLVVVKNVTGSTIVKGSTVYVNGSSGNVPTVALAKSDSLSTLPATSVICQDITNNSFGYSMKLGVLSNINTNSYTSGTILYASDSVAGAVTSTKPVYPSFVQSIGTVLVQGVGNGSILVRTTTGVGNTDTGTPGSFTAGGAIQSGGTSITAALALGGIVAVANSNTNHLISVGYGSSSPRIKGFRASGSELSPTVPTSGVTTLSLEGHSYDGASFNVSTPHVTIASITTETQSATAHGGKLVFSTTPNTTTTLTTAFTIEQDQKATFVSSVSAVSFLPGYRTQATANSTLTLVVGDGQSQYFTGTVAGQIVQLPVTSTLALNQSFIITNNSTQSIAVNSSGGNLISTLLSGSQGTFVCILLSGTTAASWSATAGGTASPLTTKGDLYGFSTVNARIPIGSNKAILAADSAQTLGLKWLDPVIAPAATQWAAWDANLNLSANNHIQGWQTIATAAGTTTLVVGSPYETDFTGTTTQTCVLPTTSIVAGQAFKIVNNSTGIVTVQSSGANTIQAMPSGSVLTVTALVATPTTAANWGAQMTVNGLLIGTAPTVQKFISGTSQTYTTPAGVLWIKVKMVGGGGGGAGSGTAGGTAATDGGDTTWVGSATQTAGKGTHGVFQGSSGAGGTATLNSPAIGTALNGGAGAGYSEGISATTSNLSGGAGGNSVFGGGGVSSASVAGGAAATNTGSGGAGGGTGSTAASYTGTGGGSGAYLEFILVPSAGATYTYSVGTGGSGGGLGTNGFAGGNGAAGYIEVTEYYPNTAVSSVLVGVAPTVQKFLSGTSQTYTTPAGVQYIRVRLIGGGAGGLGGGTAAGGTPPVAGGNTTFGTSLLTAPGGSIGTYVLNTSSTGGAGGIAGTINSPAIGTTIPGGNGSSGSYAASTTVQLNGANGGNSAFGGGGGGGSGAGNAGATNSGGGGGGGSGANSNSANISGPGGGAGAYVDAIINSPSATYTYSVGTSGSGGTAGTGGNPGGAGAAGYIEVTEYYTNLAVGTQAAITANQFMSGPSSGSAAQPNFRALTAYDTSISGYDTSTATSGTITASANKPGLVVNSAGGTTLIVLLPSSPLDGQIYFATSVGAFTTVTWKDAGGTAGNVIGGQSAWGGTNRGQTFVYSSALTKWLATS